MKFGPFGVAVGGLALLPASLDAAAILAPGDLIVAIDRDTTGAAPESSFPGNESPPNALDENSGTKYLNFGGTGSGFIVTPLDGASTAQSLLVTTANDFPVRDPASYALYGTNSPILTPENGDGSMEPWTLISTGALTLPDDRFTDGPLVTFVNNVSYTSYGLVFPTLKSATALMQVADVRIFGSISGTGPNLIPAGSTIIAIDTPADLNSESSSPNGEEVFHAIDNDVGTKYLNFGKENSGFIVQPQGGPSIVQSFTITTANDAPERDPISFELYGTNDPVTSTNDSTGEAENWALIEMGSLTPPTDRFTPYEPFVLANPSVAYSAYRVYFPGLRESANADSLQFSEVQFDGIFVPEPATVALCAVSLVGLALSRRRRR